MRRFAFLSVLLLAACASDPDPKPAPTTEASPSPSASSAPAPTGPVSLAVDTVVSGLTHPWDLGFLPDGRILVSERPARFRLVAGGTATQIRADLSTVYVAGEGGLLGLVVHPDFAQSREFTTCQTHQDGGRPVDVRVVTWRLSPDSTTAERVRDLITGIPISSGRHSGCRPTIATDGALLVGTGDAALPGPPQNRRNLGGKVLRVDLRTGNGLPDNPFAASGDANERRVYTYGHRNVQGVAVRPGTSQVFTAEHGPRGFDEMNRLRPGANYGWDPARGGASDFYDESVEMTDRARFPDAIPPLWTSGQTATEAPSGAAFISGAQWGPLNGRLAVVALRGQKTLLFQLNADGSQVTGQTLPTELNDAFGRLRGVRSGPDGALYITTSNGTDDRLLRITPRT